LTLESPSGPRALTVVAELVDYSQNGFAIVVSDTLLADSFAAQLVDVVAVRLAPGANEARVSEAITAMPGVKIETRGQLKARVMKLVDDALGAMDGLLFLAGLVGLLAVGSSVALSALERRADIAALRSLGMSRPQVAAMVCAEAVVTALVGAIWGLGVGIFLGWVFSESTHRLGIPVPFLVPWKALGLSALAVVVAALPAAFLPARRAARIPPAEALREA
ncbi:MAG TPA: ABC transporter permease, partial [Longimicrobium sp.]|nr:ABC transporter permease [Longimicrobium sp.]